jgi:RNA polymerase sigma-70 factor (ECF subfamily)
MTTAEGFEPYRDDVYQWAFRILGSHDDALDTVQDVFVRWLAQVRRASPENPRGWLRRATVNRAIDLLRARRRSDPRHQDAGYRDAPAAELRELEKDVARALATLSVSQRFVLVAKEFDGMTFPEIAVEMGLAVTTVKTHYLRALRSLKPRLAGRWGPERS